MKRKYWIVIGIVIFSLLSIVMVAFAQITSLSPVFFLPGDTVVKPAAFEQKQPVITQGGSLFLAVWTDARTDAGRKIGSYYNGNGSEIYAARLDSAGNLLDTIPLAMSQEAADQSTPQVAWNGQNWLVVWLSQRPTTFYWAWQVMAARVSPQGTLLDSQPIQLTSFVNSSSVEFTVGSDGSNWAVFWEGDSSGEADLSGARISAAGTVLDPGGRVILPAEYYLRAHLDVAFAQDEYLLTFQGINVLQGIRLHPDLTSIDASYFNISSGSYSMYRSHVESNGSDFFTVWEASVSTTYYESIRASRVSHAGQVLDPAEIIVWEGYGGFIDRWPQVAWDGSNWFVTFMLNGITVLRVSPNGSVLDPNNIPPDFGNGSNKWDPESSSVPGGGIQLVWRDTRAAGNTPDDIYTARVSANRAFGPESLISNGTPSQDRVRAAASGTGYLLAFRSEYSGVMRILAQPIDTSGTTLLSEPVQVASGVWLSSPSVAWNGSLYLVVWADSTGQIDARRLSGDGTLLDPTPFPVMPGFSPVVSALGGNFLVVGVNAPTNPQYQFPFAVRVRGTDGTVLDAPIQIGGSFTVNPDVAAFNDRWISVWEGHPSHDDSTSSINANFIFPDGTIGTGFTVQPSFNIVRFHHNPSVATNGTTALVAWSDPRVSNSDWNIYGSRVQVDGTILDTSTPLAISTAANNQGMPVLTWDGNQFVAAFEDQRANTFFMDNSTDIFATRIDASGQVLDPDGFAVFNDRMPEIFPAITGANGQTLLAGSIYRNNAPFMAYRAGLRLMGDNTLPPVATATPTTAPPITAIHSGDLDGSRIWINKNSWNATVVITVHDSGENPVSGVTVSGTWSEATTGPASCITDNTGKCPVTTGDLKKRLGSVTLTLTNLAKAGIVYDPTANHDPDSDSNGTTITVLRP